MARQLNDKKIEKTATIEKVKSLKAQIANLQKEASILRAKHRTVTPTQVQINDLTAELAQYEKMDIDDPEESTERDLEDLELLQKQREQLDEHEAELKRRTGRGASQKQKNKEESLFLDDDNDSGYESEVVIPIETFGGHSSSLPSDGRDLCFTKRGAIYYVIYERGPEHGDRVYEARKERSRRTCEKELGLRTVTSLRPEGKLQLTGIQGVVVAPGSDYRVLLRKNWKVKDKMGVPTPQIPWIQVKVQYIKEGAERKQSAFFSRSQLERIHPDGDGTVITDEDLWFGEQLVLKQGAHIYKLDLAILQAYFTNYERFDPSSTARRSRSRTVQRYSTPELNATRVDKNSRTASKVAFAAPASRNNNPRGAARSVTMTDDDLAELLAFRKERAKAQDGPSVHPDMVANTRTRLSRRVKQEEEEEEEL